MSTLEKLAAAGIAAVIVFAFGARAYYGEDRSETAAQIDPISEAVDSCNGPVSRDTDFENDGDGLVLIVRYRCSDGRVVHTERGS